MELQKKQRVLSAIQPTSIPTLGNYIGALRNWKNMSANYDCAYAVADLHAITVRQDPKALKQQTMQMFAILLAIGLDPEQSAVFVQSHVDTHAQLAWLLNCYTQFGEASRMTQFKEKSQKHADNINVGLFTYPVLMAADILLYQAHYVPIGADQKQHLEIARDIAERFNGLYGSVFTLPEPFIGTVGARVMSLQDPEKKMSKSDVNPKASISILDSPDAIVKKFKSAVTDSEAWVRYAEDKAGINNLMTIFSACTGWSYEQIESDFAGKGYGDFKLAVADAVIEELRPLQFRFDRLMKDPAYLKQCAHLGAEKAKRISQRTLDKCMKKIGFWIIGN
ncbi:MAG: tryptophan--tRNA ligase [Oscillospiraceae bacterium]|jgi:tryptophanyl-tRNA synthetase|nr:tryptophan--tRNA ligase [Oscillospiraceae bacterium]